MRGAYQVVLVLVILLAVSLIYGGLTGYAAKGRGPYATPYGAHAAYSPRHTERDMTSIEIVGNKINKDGLPVVQRGSKLTFIVKPGKNGVGTGAEIKNAVSGLRIWGNQCLRGGKSDFCSNGYTCVDKDPKKCKNDGSICFGDKLVEVQLPLERKPGKYMVEECDANDECNKCTEVRAPFMLV